MIEREDNVERWLMLSIWIVAALLIVSLAGLGVYYFRPQENRNTLPVVDRDIQILEDQIRQQPRDPELRVALANLYLEKKRYDSAIGQAEQALQTNEEHIGALLVMARANANRGRVNAAIDYLLRAIEYNENNPMARASRQLAQVHQYLGELYLDQGKYKEAISEFQRTLESDWADADTYHLLGNTLFLQGKHDDAIANYRQALRLVPDFPEVYGDLYRVYMAKNDQNGISFAKGMIGYHNGDYTAAVQALEEAEVALPEMAEVHLGLAMAYQKIGRKEEALKQYRLALDLDRGSIAAINGINKLNGQPGM